MKKVIAIAAALMLIGTSAFAQNFGAGYVQSTKTDGSSSVGANGFYAGFGYTANISSGLSLNPGVYYEFLTNSSASSIGPISYSGKTTEHYVNVPLHLSFAYSFAPTFKLFLYGGPTANFGIASKTVATGGISGIGSATSTTDNYADGSNYSRFDIMAGFGGGVEVMKKLRLTVGYDWGLLDRDNSDNYTLKRNRLTAGAAFIF
jgi:hypothetical protein